MDGINFIFKITFFKIYRVNIKKTFNIKAVDNVESGEIELAITKLPILFGGTFNLITMEDLGDIRFLVFMRARSNNDKGKLLLRPKSLSRCVSEVLKKCKDLRIK